MKKQIHKYLLLWSVALCAIAAAFFIYARVEDKKVAPPQNVSPDIASDAQPDPDGWQSVKNDAEGYSFSVPSSWYVEHTGNESLAVYPDHSSSTTCKVEMSVFPFAAGGDTTAWISGRIGADPTLTITERSTENISIGSISAIRWDGTIDDVSTTLIYAFKGGHAYEIAPSSLAASSDVSECEDALDTFLSKLTF